MLVLTLLGHCGAHAGDFSTARLGPVGAVAVVHGAGVSFARAPNP